MEEKVVWVRNARKSILGQNVYFWSGATYFDQKINRFSARFFYQAELNNYRGLGHVSTNFFYQKVPDVLFFNRCKYFYVYIYYLIYTNKS